MIEKVDIPVCDKCKEDMSTISFYSDIKLDHLDYYCDCVLKNKVKKLLEKYEDDLVNELVYKIKSMGLSFVNESDQVEVEVRDMYEKVYHGDYVPFIKRFEFYGIKADNSVMPYSFKYLLNYNNEDERIPIKKKSFITKFF